MNRVQNSLVLTPLQHPSSPSHLLPYLLPTKSSSVMSDYGDMPWPSQATVEYFLVRLMDNHFRRNFDPERNSVHSTNGFRQIYKLAELSDSNVDEGHPLITALTVGSFESPGPTDAWRRLIYYLSVPPQDLAKKKMLAVHMGDCMQAIRVRTSANRLAGQPGLPDAMSPLASQLREVLLTSCPHDRGAINAAIFKGEQAFHQRYREATAPSRWELCEHRSTVGSGAPADAETSVAKISRDGESKILSITFDAGTSMQTRWDTLAETIRKLNDGTGTLITATYDINHVVT
jgi:hypothetical protein